MATEPDYTYDWATQEVPNGPTGGPNIIIDTPQAYRDQGFVWNKAIPFELLNGWRRNVGLWLDYQQEVNAELVAADTGLQDQINAISLGDLTGSSSASWTVGDQNENAKTVYFNSAASRDVGDLPSQYITWKYSYTDVDTGNDVFQLFAKDNEWEDEYPLNPADHNILTEAQVAAIANAQIEQYHSGSETYNVDVTYYDSYPVSQATALAIADASVQGEQEGDFLNVTYDPGKKVGTGNGTKWVAAGNSTFSAKYISGAWVIQ